MQSSSFEAEKGTQEVRCDVHYHPSTTSKPVILYIHGGAWVLGGKDLGIITAFIDRAVELDWAVVSLDYRLCPHVSFDGMLGDCKDAVKWIRSGGLSSSCDREGLKVDPSALVIAGDSAGGHLCNLVHLNGAKDGTGVDGIIDMFGPMDIITPPTTLKLFEAAVFKRAYRGNEEVFKMASPSSYDLPTILNAKPKIPWLNFIGTTDGLVPIKHNRTYYSTVASIYGPSGPLVRVEVPGSFHGFCGIYSHKTDTFLEACEAILIKVREDKLEKDSRI
jgi:acetyl esterase/lipase